MAPQSLIRASTRARPEVYVCANCNFRALPFYPRVLRRFKHRSVISKEWKASKMWQADAKLILAGEKKSTLAILEERGLLFNIAGKHEEVNELITTKRVGAYLGIDPTAPSLHVGHMIPLMALFWMFVRGHHAVSVIGGATAKIGDPTGRLTTRDDQTSATRTANLVGMHYQLKRIWENIEVYGRKHKLHEGHKWSRELVNNATWMNKLTVMELLQIMGPGMRMGPMMARETVKNKMTNGDGMSFAEFTYPLLQAWDWWHMYHTKGVQLQIGGGDQFGNITAGIDAVKYVAKHHPHQDVRAAVESHAPPIGFTVPLLTSSSGAKFGKSAGNAVWLDKSMTSTFDLYGFFLRTPDVDVGRYLKLLTFVPLEQIDGVMKEHMNSPKLRLAQHLLAREFLEIAHGPEEAKAAELQHRLMFSGSNAVPRPASSFASAANGPEGSPVPEQIVLNNAPQATIRLPHSLIYTKSIGKILYAAGLAASASEGHRLASEQSIYIGGHPGGQKRPMIDGTLTFTKLKLWQPEDTQRFLIDGKLLILRKGKHNIRTIEVISDEEFVKQGLSFPDWEKMSELAQWVPRPIEGAIRRERRLAREREERLRAADEAADALSHEQIMDSQGDVQPTATVEEPVETPNKSTSLEELAQYPVDIHKIRHRKRDDPGWRNAHWHPYYIIGKGQLHRFPGARLGDPIPGVAPPSPNEKEDALERYNSVKSPKLRKKPPRKAVKELFIAPPENLMNKNIQESYKRFASAQPRELNKEVKRRHINDSTAAGTSKYTLKSERDREMKRERRKRQEQEIQMQTELFSVSHAFPKMKSMIDEKPRQWLISLPVRKRSNMADPSVDERNIPGRMIWRSKEASSISANSRRRKKMLNLPF